MTTRRKILIAGTGALSATLAGCGGAANLAVTASTESALDVSPPTRSPVPAPALTLTPNPAPEPAPAPAPAPLPALTGGSFRQLGTQTLAEFLTSVRAALPEGLNAANSRVLPVSGQVDYCGAVIWRGKYSLGVSGGHSGSFDDGHYVQDLATGNWEMVLPPSTVGSPTKAADVYGEWIPNRPAAQHSGSHQVTVGDDIVLAVSYSIGYQGSGSGQGHRWNGAAGAWERYGNLRSSAPTVHTAIYDGKRNRIVVFESQATSTVHVIQADSPTASWSKISIPWFNNAGLYQSVGYHVALDCFVLVDQRDAPNRAWVMNPDQIGVGWTEVKVQGSAATPMTWAGLEYVPPMQGFASANTAEANALYYLAPTAGRYGAWAWSKEVFSGATTPAAWESSLGVPNSPQSRVKWSSLLNALVMVKSPRSRTEVFAPSNLAK